MNDRRHRGGRSYAIPVWNGIFDHYERIGGAVWVFLWLIDAVTKEKDGVGLVHGGAPVKLSRILDDLKGADRESTRRYLEKLVEAGYIRTRRTPYGQVIEVLNSKKFNIWRKEKLQKAVSHPIEEKPQNTVSPPKEKPQFEEEKLQIAVSKEDSAQDFRSSAFDMGVRATKKVSSALQKSDDDEAASVPKNPHLNGNGNGNSKSPLDRLMGKAQALIAKNHPALSCETISACLQYVLLRAQQKNPNYPIGSERYFVTGFDNLVVEFEKAGLALETCKDMIQVHQQALERWNRRYA